jgi:hypothetical protein
VASAAWTVTRHDEEVRVGLTESASFEQADTEAILAAVKEYLPQDGVHSVRLSGPMLAERLLPHKLTNLIGDLAGLVEGRGLQFYLAPL